GKGTEKNLEAAFYWFQKAAENDDEEAMNNLATCYKNGEGIEKNLEKAFYWYKKAAENDDKNAMNNLAICYYNGERTGKNLEKAFYWFQKAVENGNKDAMYCLVTCYYSDENYQRAAENGKINKLLYDKCKKCKQLYIDYQFRPNFKFEKYGCLETDYLNKL